MSRPRRKATINKSYNDAIDLSVLEEPRTKPVKKKPPPANSVPPISPHQNVIPHNWQPTPTASDHFSFKLVLDGAEVDTTTQTLYCPNQPPIPLYGQPQRNKFVLRKGDFIYMVSEPPGEPYYIGRIMGFKRKEKTGDSSAQNSSSFSAASFVFQIQWFYRPRDISKATTDSRLLFASMHTDTCPLQSFRGLVTVKHKWEVENSENSDSKSRSPSKRSPSAFSLESYTLDPNCFYFDKLFDRYMIKFYDIVPTESLLPYANNTVNNLTNFITALHKRFQYVFMEAGRTKAFITSFSSTDSTHCDRCGQWCDSPESVACASCKKFYHMLCLSPPLLKKPSRGFSWSCAACNKKHELEYQKRRMVMLSHDNKTINEEDAEEEVGDAEEDAEDEAEALSSREDSPATAHLPKYEIVATDFLEKDAGVSFEQRRLLEEWNMRYLGMHSRLEDGVDVEDRSPYPRASTRLGAKHQATNIPECDDHPLVYYDVEKKDDGKKKKKEKKETVEAEQKLEIPPEFKDTPPKDFPPWLQPRPKGYIERGGDLTSTLLWTPLDKDLDDGFVTLDQYVKLCEPFAENLDMFPNSPNFMDAILRLYFEHGPVAALDYVAKLTRQSLKEPTLSKEEIKRFEAGVKKYGSELYPTFKEVKTQPCAMIVRYYYLWKKTRSGQQIWGNFEGRKKIQKSDKVDAKLDLVDPNDDSSYESDKVALLHKIFNCKHCHTNQSTQWFRVSGHDTSNSDIVGLCFRCARLWRRYAVVWEDPQEVLKRNTKTVGGWKKKIESELIADAESILAHAEAEDAVLSYEPVKTETSIKEVKAEPKKPEKKPKKPEVRKKPEPKPVKKTKPEPKPEKKPEAKKKPEPKPKPKPEPKVEPKQEPKDLKRKNDDTIAPVKRRKLTTLIDPVFNHNYVVPTAAKTLSLKTDLKTIVNTFRIKQLTNPSSHIGPYQVPNLAKISAPFLADERSCSICLHYDLSEDLHLEMLICSNCGVNVHLSCCGITVPLQSPMPVKEWLCSACINDLNPNHSSMYLCSLCLANDTNYELSLFGSPLVKPDYLRPILDSGKWCHLLCALYSSNYVSFRPINTPVVPKRMNIDQKTLIENTRNPFAIESVSEIFLQNYTHQCGICKTYNGSLIECDLCANSAKYHVTCAQDMPNFRLGFKIMPSGRDAFNVVVGSEMGRLQPALVCPQHDARTSGVYLMRDLGKRPTGPHKDEPKPLILLFIEEIAKTVPFTNGTSGTKLTGPQFKAHNYIHLIKLFAAKQKGEVEQNSFSKDKTCASCLSKSSPMWWQQQEKFVCQSCYHNKELEDGTDLGEILSEPVDCAAYGLKDASDRLSDVYGGKDVRLRMTIGDILS